MSYFQVITTSADDPTLIIARALGRVIIKVLGHQHRWLAGGYDLEIGHFLEVVSMVVTWWIVAFCPVSLAATLVLNNGSINTLRYPNAPHSIIMNLGT